MELDTRMADLRVPRLIQRPIFIIGCNRSGTTLLFQTLSRHAETWSLYREAKPVYHALWPIREEIGDRVTEASAHQASALRWALYRRSHNAERFTHRPILGRIPESFWKEPLTTFYKQPPVRLVEKTPSNCFRVPLLARLWPNARFVFIVRSPEPTISSLMEGWRNWNGYDDGVHKWTYLAPPAWKEYVDRPLNEICAWQWARANRTAWQDLNRMDCYFVMVRHRALIENPHEGYRRLLRGLGLPMTERFAELLDRQSERVWTRGGSEPEEGKWKRLNRRAVMKVEDIWAPLKRELWGVEDLARTG